MIVGLVNVRLEMARDSDDGCWRGDVNDELGRRRTVVKALFALLVDGVDGGVMDIPSTGDMVEADSRGHSFEDTFNHAAADSTHLENV